MGVSVIQPSFAAGELAPSLYARVDLARYSTGLKLCRNFYVMPYGGIKNRPGTRFLGQAKDNLRCRLIPFQFNDEQTYVLVFGHQHMRVIKDGGFVESSPGVPYEIVTPYAESQLFELNYTQSADVMTIVHPSHAPRELSRLAHDNWTLGTISFTPAVSPPTGLSGSARSGGSGDTTNYRYVVTSVIDNEVPEESLPTSPILVVSWDNKAGANLSWSAASGADYYNVYKDPNGSGIYGFIGRAENLTFNDFNITAVKTDTPPTGNNPFAGAGDYPGAVGYYQQRLVFAGSNNSPQTVWMSKTGAFHNFGYAIPIKDDDAITFTIAARQVNKFRHLLPLRQLLGLTTGAEWVIQGADAGVTPKTVRADVQSYNGSSFLPPIVINGSAIYVQSRGSVVSSLAYTFESDGFSGEDLTKFSPHFFRGYQLRDWTYQQLPDRLVWAARDDGVLLGMTFLPEEQLIAWHQHVTDGFVESVCSIAEGDEDALYLLVRREVGGVNVRYLERMASRQFTDIEDAFFVDCGLTYDGRNTIAVNNLGLSGGNAWEYPEVVTMTASGGHTPFSAGVVGKYFRLTRGEEIVRVKVVSYSSSTVAQVELQEVCPVSMRGTSNSLWSLMVTAISGLDHLEGKTVSILTDGDVHPQQLVSGGAIDLQYPSAVVHVGLPYAAEMETLEIDIAGGETLLDKRKAIPSVSLFLESSRNFWAGSSPEKLYEQKPPYREYYNRALPMETGISKLSISTNWSDAGRVYVTQPDPLPLTILAIIPDVVIGGKG